MFSRLISGVLFRKVLFFGLLGVVTSASAAPIMDLDPAVVQARAWQRTSDFGRAKRFVSLASNGRGVYDYDLGYYDEVEPGYAGFLKLLADTTIEFAKKNDGRLILDTNLPPTSENYLTVAAKGVHTGDVIRRIEALEAEKAELSRRAMGPSYAPIPSVSLDPSKVTVGTRNWIMPWGRAKKCFVVMHSDVVVYESVMGYFNEVPATTINQFTVAAEEIIRSAARTGARVVLNHNLRHTDRNYLTAELRPAVGPRDVLRRIADLEAQIARLRLVN